MTSPRVTIILSSLNHSRFIGEAIQSVLDQTFTDFELFIIDDCSEDNSWQVIQSFNDPRITAIRNPVRLRGAYGYNETIRYQAKGEFIAIHHSDDLWSSTKLEKQVIFLDEYKDVGAVFTQVDLITEDNKSFSNPNHYYHTAFRQENRNRFEWLRYFFLEGNCLCHPSVMARRQVMIDAGLYDRRLGQITDFDLWVRICLRHQIHILDEKLTKFRIREGNANQSGETSSMLVRSRNEWPIVLGRFLSIDSEAIFFSVFPEMRNIAHPSENNLLFLLAIRATETDTAFRVQFGLQTLYVLMADDRIAAELKEKYGFGYIELITLSERIDPFHNNELSKMISYLRTLQNEVTRVKSTISWRITSPLRVVWNLYLKIVGKKIRKSSTSYYS